MRVVGVDMEDFVLVFIGGGLGAVSRWILSSIVQRHTGILFPWGTLVVNVIGSLLLGFVMGASKLYGVFTREQRLLIATGFAGGFTTFSTFSYESLALLAEAPLYGLANIMANVLGGLLAVYSGYVLAGVIYAKTMA